MVLSSIFKGRWCGSFRIQCQGQRVSSYCTPRSDCWHKLEICHCVIAQLFWSLLMSHSSITVCLANYSSLYPVKTQHDHNCVLTFTLANHQIWSVSSYRYLETKISIILIYLPWLFNLTHNRKIRECSLTPKDYCLLHGVLSSFLSPNLLKLEA